MKLIQQMSKKYMAPTLEKIDFQTEDILTTSSESVITNKIQTIEEKFPNGLPLDVLKNIDWKLFGFHLGKYYLLPSNYLLEPVEETIIENPGNEHQVILKFVDANMKDYIIVKIKKFEVEAVVSKSGNSVYCQDDDLTNTYKIFAESVVIGLETNSNFWMKEKGKGV